MWMADENIPGDANAFMCARGEDVVPVAGTSRGIPDAQVLELARDQDRILLTFDRDRGDLIFFNRGVAAPRRVVYHVVFAEGMRQRPLPVGA